MDVFKHILNAIRLVVATLVVWAAPMYTFFEYASVMSSYMPGKNAQMASMGLGIAAAATGLAYGALSGGGREASDLVLQGGVGSRGVLCFVECGGAGYLGFASEVGAAASSETEIAKDDELKLLARVTFAESAGQYKISGAMEGVAFDVKNRVESRLFGSSYADVIFQKGQFASVGGKLWELAGNPSALTGANAEAYAKALSVAEEVYHGGNLLDPTMGARYFHSGPPSAWFQAAEEAGKINRTSVIGPFTFYK